jgi:hypothetical protein
VLLPLLPLLLWVASPGDTALLLLPLPTPLPRGVCGSSSSCWIVTTS